MHAQIEKLRQLFSQGKSDPAALAIFYEQLWLTGGTLPRPELRSMIDEVLEWSTLQDPVQQSNAAIATLASGFCFFHEGKFEVSLLTLAEAHRLFADIKDEDGVQATTVMEGCDYRTIGELELALKCLLDAYQHLSKSNRYKTFEGFCIYNLAEIYSETGQYDEALRFHQLTEKLTSELGNRNMLSRALNGTGVVYQHQKKYALAQEYLTKALKLAEELNNRPVIARALTDLGSYYFEMGDYTAATDHQQQALAIRNEMKIENGAVTNLILLADISVKTGKPDEAIERLNKALGIAEEIKVKPKMFQIHLMLSEIYQSKGDLVKSLFHYKTYHHIREEVQHEDNEKKIKNLQLIFEAEQTKKENVIIKAQKTEIENKNIQLQETLDELTITRVSRKAKVLTFILGITLIVAQDPVFGLVLSRVDANNYFLNIMVKIIIILSLKPIDIAIQNYLLRRIVLKKRRK